MTKVKGLFTVKTYVDFSTWLLLILLTQKYHLLYIIKFTCSKSIKIDCDWKTLPIKFYFMITGINIVFKGGPYFLTNSIVNLYSNFTGFGESVLYYCTWIKWVGCKIGN